MKLDSVVQHPGCFVRENVLAPRGLTVTEAAKLIGLSRPSVSNFLNGKVSATPNMAARLERVFGISATEILEMQTKYDAQVHTTVDAAQNARSYVPSFLNFKANDIEEWFSKHNHARTLLAVLLRILIHSTGRDLQKVDFPGNDDAERPGWDGFVDAGSGTPWIPSGVSGWEFGVNKNVKEKADRDFANRVLSIDDAERANTSFVFVTPRRWVRKNDWVARKKSEKLWKDVRVYDASDLEQWMEQSLVAQTWFANQANRPSYGVRTLDRCWFDWANVTIPVLHPSLFAAAIETWNDTIRSFLMKDGADPLVVTADSVEEALAFLSQVLTTPEFEKYKDLVLVFDEVGVLPKLAQGATDFIAVAHTREVEREFGPYSKSLRTIVIYPRNAIAGPDIELLPLRFEAFQNALKAMDQSRDEIVRLNNASCRSLTVLRRLLSNTPAVRIPAWAEDPKIATEVVPLALVGAWNVQNEADKTILSEIAGVSFDELDNRIRKLLRLNDSPVWSIGEFQGVTSKIDSFFAVAGMVTRTDIERFFKVALTVLGEEDPALDLPEGERWAAVSRGKRRKFSNTVRESIAETLVLLAVNGKDRFGKCLDFDGEREVAKTLQELLLPLTTKKLEANDHELPLYAEAAPKTFLRIIEDDLRAEESEVKRLLRPVNTGFFDSCPRAGLLWALEGLAWNPNTFPRVVKILAQLSEVEINDNWGNKPIESLNSIFRVWMPQTAANSEMRLKAIRMLLEKHPAVGWKVCIQQLPEHGRFVGKYSYKPKWRPDGHGVDPDGHEFGEPFTNAGPIHAFVKEMVELVLDRSSYTVEMLCDLVSRLYLFAPDHQARVWEIIGQWRDKGANNEDIASLREKIRLTFFSRWGRKKFNEGGYADLLEKARAVYADLQSRDIVSEYEWLFRRSWVDELPEEYDGDELDFRALDRHVEKLRAEALINVVREQGISGVIALSDKGKCQREIGYLLVSGILTDEQMEDLILQCLSPSENDSRRRDIISGALWSLSNERRKTLYESLRGKISEGDALSLLFLSPYRASTWELVDQLSTEARSRYWDEVVPRYLFNSPDENNESIRRLLEVGRPRAAFVSMQIKLEEVRPSMLVQMLYAMTQQGQDKEGECQLDSENVRHAFELINQNSALTLEEKAWLEFAYLEVLTPLMRWEEQRRIPNLERYIEEHPEFFVRAVVWVYKRDDGREDPVEFHVSEDRDRWAQRGYHLLETLGRIPGQDKRTKEEQREKLEEWVTAVRRSCAELSRSDIGDFCLGKLFSNSSIGEDGVWPNEAIRDVMEDLQSTYISQGAYTGLYNARGAHWRKEGGDQERGLADKYRAYANALLFSHPFVSSTVLMSIVETYEHEAEERDTEVEVRNRLSNFS